MTDKEMFKLIKCYQSPIDIDLVVNEMKEQMGDREISESLLSAMAMQSIHEVELYCNRLLDESYVTILAQIGIIKINRFNTEGLASMSMSGVSESYLNDYPENIKAILKSKRKVKLL